MAALRTAPRIALTRRPSPPRFEIGDRVLLEPNGAEGLVVGVRYGAPAYDVQVNGACLRNLPPDRIRLAELGRRRIRRDAAAACPRDARLPLLSRWSFGRGRPRPRSLIALDVRIAQ